VYLRNHQKEKRGHEQINEEIISRKPNLMKTINPEI
jgi:hypothetical protein